MKKTFDATKTTKDELAEFLIDFGNKYSMGYIVKKKQSLFSSAFNVDEIESLMYLAVTKTVNRIWGSFAQKKINETVRKEVIEFEELKEVEELKKQQSRNLYRENDDFSLTKNVIGLFVRTFNREVNAYIQKNLMTYKRGSANFTANVASFDIDYYAEGSCKTELSIVLECVEENKKAVDSEVDNLCSRILDGISIVAPQEKVEKYKNFAQDIFTGNCSVKEALKVHKIGRNGQSNLYRVMAEVVRELNLDEDDMEMIQGRLTA